MEITETFTPNSRFELRNWFLKYHSNKPEIWIVFFKKHTGKTTISYDEAVEEAVCVGWIDGIEKRIDDEKYALRFTPRKKNSNWSETNIARYKKMLKLGLIRDEGKKAYNSSTRSTKLSSQ